MKSFLKIWDPFLPDEAFEQGGIQNHLEKSWSGFAIQHGLKHY